MQSFPTKTCKLCNGASSLESQRSNPVLYRHGYLAIGCVTILPVRIILNIIVFFCVWVTMVLPMIGVKPREHLGPIRRFLVTHVTRRMIRVQLFVCGFLWIRYEGKRQSHRETPVNVKAPHCTPFDGFFTGGIVYGSPMICSGVMDSIFTRPIMMLTEAIPIAREAKARVKIGEEVLKFLKSPGKQTHLMAFPEGTCSSGRSMICFRRGAFAPGVAVQPIVLDYMKRPVLAAWTFDALNLLLAAAMHLSRFYTPLTIRFLDPYHPSEAEKSDPTLYANNVQAVMARSLNMPHTQHSLDDGKLVYAALRLGMPSDVGSIETGVTKSALGLNTDELTEQLVRYSKFNSARNGDLTLQEMTSYLAWPIANHMERMFGLYDTGHHQKLTFRDFLFGLVDLSLAVPESSRLQSDALKLLQADGGVIDAAGVKALLSEAMSNVSDEEAEVLLSRWSNLCKLDAGSPFTADAFTTLLSGSPEYTALIHWTLRGLDSYPVNEEITADDEPDKRVHTAKE